MDAQGVGLLLWIVGVKLGGYTAAGVVLKKKYGVDRPAAWTVGVTRTVLGWVGAGIVAGVVQLMAPHESMGLLFALVLLVRALEWAVVFTLFFERPQWQWERAQWRLIAAVAFSCALDVPVILGILPNIHMC